MQTTEPNLINQIRQYLYNHSEEKLNVINIASELGIPSTDILSIAPTPSELVTKLFIAEFETFKSIFTDLDFDKEGAIDSMIIAGQEIYKRFCSMNPAITIHLRDLYPTEYQIFQKEKIAFIEETLKTNLTKGISQSEYCSDIDTDSVIKKYMEKICELHNPTYLQKGQLTFGTVFSNIIEDFILDVASEEGRQYYRQRKQLIEVFYFGH
ncbi:hypothetical protein DMA11_23100 [Marinilabiliaceae bacterium JC017]|nr:hypothetical protein DMA11_23100 [Marinilabiliaceae bacterium JC017]